MPSIPLLEVRNLQKTFGGVHAVDSVSFSVDHGEVVALVGDNGAGKSTVIKIISGAYKRDGGDILFNSSSVSFNSPEDARTVGIETMYQDLALVPDLDAAGNIFLGQEPMRRSLGVFPVLDKRAMQQRSQELLDRIKISLPVLDRPVRMLSGGQRQATAIARFLLSERAKLIVMDEPTAALGVKETQKVIDLIRNLKNEDLSILVISHNLDHVFTVADRIVVLQSGKVAGVVKTNEVNKQDVVSLIVGGVVA